MEVFDELPADVPPLEFDPAIGDVICRMLKELCGEAVDIVLVVNREGTWSKPCFVTSMTPDDMEALIIGYGDVMKRGVPRAGVKHSDGVN